MQCCRVIALRLAISRRRCRKPAELTQENSEKVQGPALDAALWPPSIWTVADVRRLSFRFSTDPDCYEYPRNHSHQLCNPSQRHRAEGQRRKKGKDSEPCTRENGEGSENRYLNSEHTSTRSVGASKMSFRHDPLGIELNPPSPQSNSSEDQCRNDPHSDHSTHHLRSTSPESPAHHRPGRLLSAQTAQHRSRHRVCRNSGPWIRPAPEFLFARGRFRFRPPGR